MDTRRLRVMTLNVAHGRGGHVNQVLLPKSRITANLNDIASLIEREQPSVVALQEVDGSSWWSGGFSHAEYLARLTGYHYFHGEHVRRGGIGFGSALLSKNPMMDTREVSFTPTPPTFTKGFVVGRIKWPDQLETQVMVVSMNLDYSRVGRRTHQIQEVVEVLMGYDMPLVVMGDFNCEWLDGSGVLQSLASGLGVGTYAPELAGLKTFPLLKKRLDWIFISSNLQFATHQVLSDKVSDHLAVIADIDLVLRNRAH